MRRVVGDLSIRCLRDIVAMERMVVWLSLVVISIPISMNAIYRLVLVLVLDS